MIRMQLGRVDDLGGAEEIVAPALAPTFMVSREVLEEMLDRARRGEDNDDIFDTTRGLYGLADRVA